MFWHFPFLVRWYMLGRSITFHSLSCSLHRVLFHFPTLLQLLLFPSLAFFIPISSDLCMFTRIQETHKGIWVLLLKKTLFKHVTYYTIPTQKTHYTGCPKMSATWIQPDLLDSGAFSFQTVSQTRTLCSLSSLLLVPCSQMHCLPLICSFLHIFLPEPLPPTVPFPLFSQHFIPHYPLSSGLLPMPSMERSPLWGWRQECCQMCASCLPGAQQEPSWISKRQEKGGGALLMQVASGKDAQTQDLPKFFFFPKNRPGRTCRK